LPNPKLKHKVRDFEALPKDVVWNWSDVAGIVLGWVPPDGRILDMQFFSLVEDQ